MKCKALMHVIYISYRDDSQAKVWSSSRLVAQGIKQAPKEVLQDGLHISKNNAYNCGQRAKTNIKIFEYRMDCIICV
jgi:hypothetical protein